MSNKNDKIFQLSLTEIAFILVFILMFLLGSMVFLGQKENQGLKEMLKELGNFEQKKSDLDKAKKLVAETLAGSGISDPAEVIKNLVDSANSHEEIAKLKKQIIDQDAKITALSEIQKAIDATKGQGEGALVQEQIEQALSLSKELKEQLQARLEKPEDKALLEDTGRVAEKVKELVASVEKLEKSFKEDPLLSALPGETPEQKLESLMKEYRQFDALKKDGSNPILVRKENSDLKGQIQFLKNRLEANGGMDFPPCWADANGKVQMLLTVELHENKLYVSRAWPDSREADAKALPNISAVLAAPTSAYPAFLRAVKPISDLGRQLNCRHYVRIKNLIPDAVFSDRRRLSIEDHFYKVEVRR
ncbi:hypothetical protein PS914_05736 [Pseudomonas fluorescens]|uniref:hypothetical protein n=1 Tax=Pseudomonas fluorescens TaxID=294 RepID=UPI00123F9F49|nr:hypothetical protein [Pseudomonas fluorescens]VVQ15461.1 hypothetical protein PS914_05736 [Pseudomonas fluorescens]